jgi:hypothetical protein
MHNQHAGLSQTLAAQHITDLRQQATHQRLLATARRPRRRAWSLRRWLLHGQPSPQTS